MIDPIPIQHDTEETEDEEDYMSNGEDPETKEGSNIKRISMSEPPPAHKKKRRTIAEWEERVGSRFLTKE